MVWKLHCLSRWRNEQQHTTMTSAELPNHHPLLLALEPKVKVRNLYLLHTEKRMLCYSIQQLQQLWWSVCISTDGLSSVFISPDLFDTNSSHQCCWSIMPVTACSQHTCIILLHQTDTALATQQTVPVWYRQFWTVCRWQQFDTAMTSYLYQGLKVQQAVTGLAFLRVYIWGFYLVYNL